MKQALKPLLFALLLISILSIIVFFSAEAGVLAGSIKLPPLLVEHPVRTLAVLVVIVGVLSYVLWRLQSSTQEEKKAAVQRDRQRDRTRMMRLVQGDVTKQLADSLQDATFQALGLRKTPEAVLTLSSTSLTRPNEPAQEETSIVHAYEEAEGKLLILGEPGAGKSTLLLQLADHLLTQAQDEKSSLPMPIVFNLSSWKPTTRAQKRQGLGAWMVEELYNKYRINRKLGQSWVEDDDILPLLDGWDEVAKEQREACVDAINVYLQEHGLVPTVVCSRKEEYWSQPRQFALEHAVEVQPLTPEQINKLLSSGGRKLAGLRKALKTDATLRELTPIPLMLNLMILAYQGSQAKDIIQSSSLSNSQRQVLADYVQRRLRRRVRYTQEQTLRWLGWLACQMKAHQQSELYLEQFQPNWLLTKQTWLYRGSVVLFIWLLGGLLFVLLFGLLGWMEGWGGGLFFGLQLWLICGLLGGLRVGLREKIEPAEALTWSWEEALSGLLDGLLFGLGLVLITGLIGWLFGGVRSVVLAYGLLVSLGNVLFIVLIFGLLGGLLYGLSSRQLPTHPPSPNERIRRSVKNGLFGGLPVLLFFGLPVGLFVGLSRGLLVGLQFGLVVGLLGLVVVLFVGLQFGRGVLFVGLTAAVQHYILRFWLWGENCTPIPWRYVAFLDDAKDQLLLGKVGGGYIFRHRLLQDYFASLEFVPPHDCSVRTEAHSV